MELNAYLQLFRRWLWLIILMAVVFGSAGFIVARVQPARYQATTTIQVGGYSAVANPNTGQIQTAEQLAQTYAALIKTRPIFELVKKNLNLDIPLETLSGIVQTRLVTGTSLIVINVTYTNPVVASDIANELATQLIANSPTNLTQEQQQQLTILQEEITAIQQQLKTARDELNIIDANLSQKSGQELIVLTARRGELIAEINTAQSNLAEISTAVSKLQQEGNSNTLRVVEPSSIPEMPVGASVATVSLIAALIGAMLAFGIGYISEYLNNSIRSPEEILSLLNISLIGAVTPFGKKRIYDDKLVTWDQPRSAVAEAYRAMRVNLMYKQRDKDAGCHTYVITSAGPSEGKSVTTANLAIAFAFTGMRVLLIDADLRRPTAHLLFGLPNTVGLSTILKSNDLLKRTSTPSGEGRNFSELLLKFSQNTHIPGLDVLTAGPISTTPAELLSSNQMQYFVQNMMVGQQYDAVFWDTPPVLVVSDSSVVATLTNAQVIMVIQSGRTNRAAAVRAVQQLTSLSLPVAGAVLNRLDPRDVDTGYGQYYYGYSRYLDNTGRQESAGKKGNLDQ